MTWTLVFVLAAGAFGFKVLGLVFVGDRSLPPVLERCLGLIPAALVAALVVKDMFSVGQHLQIDARAAGVGAAILAAWWKAPLILIIVIGAAVTAVVRAASESPPLPPPGLHGRESCTVTTDFAPMTLAWARIMHCQYGKRAHWSCMGANHALSLPKSRPCGFTGRDPSSSGG